MKFFSWKNETSSMGDPLQQWEFSEQPVLNLPESHSRNERSINDMFQEVLDRLDRIEGKLNNLRG